MAEKKRILFFIESFSGGGAEKVLLTILQNFDYNRFRVTVMVCSDVGAHCDRFHNLPIDIRVVFPTAENSIQRLLHSVRYKLLYRLLPARLVAKYIVNPNEYDTIVSFVEGYCTKIFSYLPKKIKKIAWVHTDLHNNPWTLDENIFKDLAEEINCYKRFDKVVCVSKSVEQVMNEYYNLSNTTTIYNPINEKEIAESLTAMPSETIYHDTFNMTVIGRLVHQKGIDKLLPLIARLKSDGLDFVLHIIGDGQERNNIENQISELGISDRVKLHGFLKSPYPLLSQMDLLVCPSVVEGFSLVIAEALCLGVPVISMNCSGPNELLDEGKYGELCDDYDGLYASLHKAITDSEYLAELKTKANERKPFFDTKNTIKQIEELL